MKPKMNKPSLIRMAGYSEDQPFPDSIDIDNGRDIITIEKTRDLADVFNYLTALGVEISELASNFTETKAYDLKSRSGLKAKPVVGVRSQAGTSNNVELFYAVDSTAVDDHVAEFLFSTLSKHLKGSNFKFELLSVIQFKSVGGAVGKSDRKEYFGVEIKVRKPEL